MGRVGRKRSTGPRYPGGQLKKKPSERDIDDRVRASRQPHRRALAQELKGQGREHHEAGRAAAGEEAESPIGRLWAAGRLAASGDLDSQAARARYDAAAMYAQIVGAYRSVIEGPRDVAGSGRGYPCQGLLCALARETCECEWRKLRYMRAFEALTGAGRRALMAVNAVAVHREPIGVEDLVYLVAGLEALRRIFGLTGRRKARQYENAN